MTTGIQDVAMAHFSSVVDTTGSTEALRLSRLLSGTKETDSPSPTPSPTAEGAGGQSQTLRILLQSACRAQSKVLTCRKGRRDRRQKSLHRLRGSACLIPRTLVPQRRVPSSGAAARTGPAGAQDAGSTFRTWRSDRGRVLIDASTRCSDRPLTSKTPPQVH